MQVKAHNYQVFSNVNFTDNTVKVTGLMKSFEFELGAIDRAFNSNKLDLSGYPKFNYEGNITEPVEVDYSKPGDYLATVDGFLYIGEFKRKTPAKARFVVKDDGSIDVVVDFSFQIEEQSMETINRLMKERLPSLISVDTNTLGISRDVTVHLSLTYK